MCVACKSYILPTSCVTCHAPLCVSLISDTNVGVVLNPKYLDSLEHNGQPKRPYTVSQSSKGAFGKIKPP